MISRSELEVLQRLDDALVNYAKRDAPACLRGLSHFTIEAQRAILRFVVNAPTRAIARSGRKVAMACLEHAIRLFNYMDIQIDTAGEVFLEQTVMVRNLLANDLGIQVSKCVQLDRSDDREKNPPDSYLFYEAAELLDLATTQYQEGMRRDAYNSFHLASIFYRVLDSMLPAMAAEIQVSITNQYIYNDVMNICIYI